MNPNINPKNHAPQTGQKINLSNKLLYDFKNTKKRYNPR